MDRGFIQACKYIDAYIIFNLGIKFFNFTVNFTLGIALCLTT